LALDHAIEGVSSRPLGRITPRALAILRLGAYQILETRIPDHAAVAETVALAAERERGFVNAVLRRLAAEPPSPPVGSSAEAVGLRTGLSAWAVRELLRLVGEEAEEAARGLASQGPLTLRVNTCRRGVREVERALLEAGVRSMRGTLHPESLLVAGVSPSELPGFEEGWFVVQDQASALVVRALGPEPGERVIDVCAAPGGKATHIACLVGPEGLVVAADAREHRAALVREAGVRLGLLFPVLVQDARRPAVRGPFDRVLVDAPCSGIGSARRRPELLWRTPREGLPALARLQLAIASASAELLAPGGTLVYSVCTFPRAETDGVCDALLGSRPELEPAEIEGPEGPAQRVRLWPHRHGTDSMFMAAFRRRG
jgi:16S rRNA (cytosine967-C5)-methyltransferase